VPTGIREGAPLQVKLDGKVYQIVDFTVDEIAPLAPQQRTGLSDSDRADDYESAVRFSTWHSGFGLGEIREDADKGRVHYSQNIDSRFRSQLILGPQLVASAFAANPESKVQFVEFNGSFYAVGLRYVHVFNLATGQWDSSKDMGATSGSQNGSATVFGDYLVVGAGDAVDYWRLSTAGVWDQPSVGTKAQLMAMVGSTLWRTFNANQLSSSANFTTWTTAVAIGDSRNTATMLQDYNANPMVGKPEGLFEYDSVGKVSNRLPELAFRLSPTNCRGGKPAQGKLYLPVGPMMWQYTTDTVQTEGKPTRSAEFVAPGVAPSSSNEVRGSIVDTWPDIDFLWSVMSATSGSQYLLAYDYNPTVGQGWHQVVRTGTTAVTALGRFQPSTGSARMFFSEGVAIRYFLLPRDAQNPYVDTNYRYNTSGDVWLPSEADVFDDVDKAYLSLRLTVDNATTARYADVAYSVDSGAELTLGRVVSPASTTLYFPTNTQGKRLALHIKLVTNDSTISPRITPFSRHYQLRFTRKRTWKFGLVLGRKTMPNVPRQALDQLKTLEAARGTVPPVPFTDPDGRSWVVFVKTLGESKSYDDGAESVKGTPVELLEWRSGGGSNLWNSAEVFDDAARWSTGTDNYTAAWS